MTSEAAGDSPRPGVVALGIDIGSTNIKASLVCIGAAVIEIAVCSTPTPPGADELIRATVDLVRSVLVSAPEAPAAVGIASMAESGVPLGEDDRPLRPVLRWDGNDDVSDLTALLATLGEADVFAATGVPALPKAPLAMWARLRRTDPQLWSKVHRWAGVADLVGLALTDVLATDHTLAARTMAYRMADLPRSFDGDLLAAVGLTPTQLPAVRRPGEPVGGVTETASRTTGLAPGTPVYIAGHDHAVGAWAAGVRRPGEVADSLGTAEALVRVLASDPDPESVRGSGMSITRTVTGEPALLAGSANAGSFVRWWFAHRIGAREAGEVLDDLARLPQEPTGLLVLPYLNGRQTPSPDRRSDVRVLDDTGTEIQPRGRDVAVLARAMLEGVAFHARWMLEEQIRVAGPATAPLRILGGPGGGNRPWMDVKARVFSLDSVLVTVSEPVASGAALLAATRAGLLPADPPVLAATPLVRDPQDPYQQMFERFVAAARGATPAREGER
ncbi:MAG: Carbohydrate kinase, FGGY-like protein [Naasia sp.]|uniref:FGGY-family carbohydrate kinase n=1 Tax=Naasia sp. TaxID=2546198 RepID=UPI0026277316|nr:FGGY family carbohydrate kinase [Naasia sp.]MCU1570701.1 Carbohydrate kinase, FGGY-like protein [Naasia sp.]